VAGTKDAINMVEAGAEEVSEEVILDAIMFAHNEIIRLVEFQEKIVEAVAVDKFDVDIFEIDEDIQANVKSEIKDKLVEAIQVTEKHAREDAIGQVKEDLLAQYDEDDDAYKHVKMTFDNMVKDEVR